MPTMRVRTVPAKSNVKVSRKTIVKPAVQPSKVMGFTPSVPVEKSLYRQDLVDSPDYWATEYGYLGDMAADDSATAPAPAAPWYQQLIDVYGAYKAQQLALQQQDQLAKQNAALTAAGKPPMNMADYMKYNAPQVNVGLSSSTMNMLLYGGLGLGAILLIGMVMKRR